MNWIIFILLIILGGILSVCFGQATNEFDVLNYHIYAPYAFLTHRIGFDILPCGIRSYFNPILDIPYYFMVKYWNEFPTLVTFLQGTYYGIILFIGYKISDLIFIENSRTKVYFNLFSVIIIGTSAVIMYEVGTLYNDLQVAIFICTALYLYLKYLFEVDSNKRSLMLVLASALLGAVFGLKLTSAIMIFGMFIAAVCFVRKIDKPLKTLFICALSFFLGFIVVNGYWYYLMYSTFKNPFFPYYNNIFKSEYGSFFAVLDESYKQVLPVGWFKKVFYPFLFFAPKRGSGFGSWLFRYVDWRYALTSFAIFYLSIKIFLQRKFEESKLSDKRVLFLIIFTLSTYIVWLNVFAIVRYIVPLIIISCILINASLVYLADLIKNKSIFNVTFNEVFITLSLLLLALLFNTTKISINETRLSLTEKVFDIRDVKIKDNSLVLLASQMTSIIIPYQNKNARYAYLVIPIDVNLENTAFTYKERTIDYYYSEYYEKQVNQLIKGTKDIYFVYLDDIYSVEKDLYNRAMIYYTGKPMKFENCKKIADPLMYGRLSNITICKLSKL